MPLNAKLIRRSFLASGLLLLFVVISFYLYARHRIRSAVHDLPQKLGVNIQQSTSGFTFSKSEGGRTLFSVSAARATQYKEGQRAALEDVRILIYARDAGYYDQIYGNSFEYDPRSGEVRANGEVAIDLEAKGKPDAANPSDIEGAVHLKTSGMIFNQKTGRAATEQQVDFAFPQARGRATGARYDSKTMTLTLISNIVVDLKPAARTANHSPFAGQGRLTADNAVITDQPREAILRGVHFDQPQRSLSTTNLTVSLREDNTIESVRAQGEVRQTTRGKNPSEVRAGAADFRFDASSAARSAQLTGGVEMTSTGASPAHGAANRVDVSFAGKNQIEKARASGNAHFEQTGNSGQKNVIDADAIDVLFRGNRATRVLTSGRSQIVLDQIGKVNAAPSRSVITAGAFTAEVRENRLRSLHGEPDARIVSSVSGQPDRVSTSRSLDVTFDPARGGIASAIQSGDFHYQEGGRTAFAKSAIYSANDGNLLLRGSPIFQDRDHGLSVTANEVRINRRTGDASAVGDVKTTYSAGTTTTNGPPVTGIFSGADTVHITSSTAVSNRQSEEAHFTGGVRLWQGANVVEAPQMDFNRTKRTLIASAPQSEAQAGSVQTVFVQADRSGKVTPVSVTATRLTYSDQSRKAHFEGRVTVKGSGSSLQCDQADLRLRPRNEATAGASPSQPGQLDEINAQGNVQIMQEQPSRKASGSRLTYVAAEEKWVLAGDREIPASIFDAEHGDLTGDSLTFYSHGDTVHVGSGQVFRTVTRTTVKDKSPR